MIDEVAATAAVEISMSPVTQHSVPRVLTQNQRDERMSTCGCVLDSADKDVTFLNQIIGRNMLFSVGSTTEATTGHLKNAIITKKEETAKG
jgi:hypothetical protein